MTPQKLNKYGLVDMSKIELSGMMRLLSLLAQIQETLAASTERLAAKGVLTPFDRRRLEVERADLFYAETKLSNVLFRTLDAYESMANDFEPSPSRAALLKDVQATRDVYETTLDAIERAIGSVGRALGDLDAGDSIYPTM